MQLHTGRSPIREMVWTAFYTITFISVTDIAHPTGIFIFAGPTFSLVVIYHDSMAEISRVAKQLLHIL